MSKIINYLLKGKKLITSKGTVQFDSEGIADIQDEEIVESLLGLDGYTSAEGNNEEPSNDTSKEDKMEDKSDEEEKPQDNDENTLNEEVNNEETEGNDEEGTEVEFTEEKLTELNVPQLRKVAKDNNIDLAGATKKPEMIAIILGAMAK